MRTIIIFPFYPLKKKLLATIIVLCSLVLSGYTSLACTANFTYKDTANGHYTFTSTSVGFRPGAQYLWNPGDGSGWHYGGPTFNYIYQSNGTFPARLFVTDSICSDTATISIVVSNVNTPCHLSANFNYSVGAHGVVTFTSTSTGTNAYTQYYWVPGDSNLRIHGTNTYSHKYLYKGYYGVWLIIKDTGLSYCVDSIYRYIDVLTADSSVCHIHPNFTYTTGANGQVTFTNTSTGTLPGDYYIWSLGDTAGSHFGAGPFTYTYKSDNTYYVKLVIWRNDSSGCSDSITLPVTVTNACNMQANFTWAYDSVGQIKFTSTSTGVNGSTKYLWSFGDGSPYYYGIGATYDSVTHQYPFLGYYDVTLFDSGGGCASSITKRVYIYNKDSLKACFTYMADSLVHGQYDFNAGCSQGTYQYTYYKWTPGDGDPSDSGLGMTTYQHTYLHNGPYSATLTIWYTILPHRPQLRSNPEYDLSSFTETINVQTATGIAQISNANSYTIYPNPSNGSFNIGLNGIANGQNAEIRISNVIGQVIYNTHTTLSGNTIPVTMGAAPTGIYLLQVITATNTYTSKIIVQK